MFLQTLHVSAINVGHLQVVHEALNDKLYLHVWGYSLWGGVGARSRLVFLQTLHVSTINVGHLQVVHEAINDKLYLHVSGFTVCGMG